MKKLLLFAAVFFLSNAIWSSTLEVGEDKDYTTIQMASIDAIPGDTILVFEGTYTGGMFIENLNGTPEEWITIISKDPNQTIIEGGNNAIQFSQISYIELNGFIIQGQYANGLNVDDGGTFDTPSHHIRIRNCKIQNIAADGNNDLLKMSGIDSFWVEECLFLNGATGGSGLDMVGCHHGFIRACRFENMGNNGIQAKGGTQHIRIERNFFKNSGLRNINLGGSTGLAFFRPQDAPFEAADLQVYANIFVGGWAGLAYVGSTRVDVANNTFYYPENWVFRILQENVDDTRFIECGDNAFRNNIVVYGNVHRDVNVGPNTRPESFAINHNIWFKPDNPDFSGPQLPIVGLSNLIQVDPLLVDPVGEDFHIDPSSPAIGFGFIVEQGMLDFYQVPFSNPPSIGAAEGSISSTYNVLSHPWKIYPNPTTQHLAVMVNKESHFTYFKLLSIDGKEQMSGILDQNINSLDLSRFSAGSYILQLRDTDYQKSFKITKY
jgi:hypothetical protein